jgi:CTP:phosphocholine cytidylyltransferase-like protein
MNTAVILLCASEGKRTKSFGPRSLLSVHGETLIDSQLEEIKSIGIHEIIIGLGFGADKIIKHLAAHNNVKFVENENYNLSGAARTLNMTLRITNAERIILAHGDISFNNIALKFPTNGSYLLIDRSTMEKDKVGVNIIGNHVIGFNYSAAQKWGQIASITGEELSLLRKLCSDRKNDMLCTHELFGRIIDKDGVFNTYISSKSKIKEINRK